MDYSMLEILIIIIMLYTLIRFISLKKQLRKIEKQVYNKERVNITLNDRDIEKLAATINNNMQEQKQVEIDIMNREERLKQNISDIAHDLRTPLASIRGYITLLDNCTEQEKKEYINIIERKSEELNLLINNFYEISLFDNSSLKIQTTSIDIVQVIMEIVISNYALIKNNEIEIDNRLPEKQIKIYGEELTCKRIIQNLISNSIKYSNGYISIQLDEFDNEVIFTIKNSVLELKESDLEHLFERFYTVDKSRNRSGSGLGLYIVKLLLKKIGGEVRDISLEDDILSISIMFKAFVELDKEL
ncbi:GHKL domain-containing protein [Paeniclostridium sordellii]|nr:GHKL domain-containing protein [Paeniclostridium sordellii]MSB59375.1 GHKL domain-containing protein [Paeniclostridium sordellii]